MHVVMHDLFILVPVAYMDVVMHVVIHGLMEPVAHAW